MMPMHPAMCLAQCIQRQYIACLLNVDVLHTGIKITALAVISSALSPALKYLSMIPMRPDMCPAQWLQRKYIAYLLNINVLHTGTTITAPAEITSAQSPALKYVPVMPMHPDMCPAQWIQLENIACLLSIVFQTVLAATADREHFNSSWSAVGSYCCSECGALFINSTNIV
jgi:hypothetical protein